LDYIPDIDEMLATAPYYLGTNDQDYRFECHEFLLVADRLALRDLVNEQLNAALGWTAGDDPEDPPYGAVIHKSYGTPPTSEKIRYIVPASIERVVLSFIRYWRVRPVIRETDRDQGWMAYTEVLIRFIVQRQIEGVEAPQEGLTFVATVYIDDSGYMAPLTDPPSMPIVLGREAYGMPKSPGEIFYCPTPHHPHRPRLRLWDNPDNDRVRLHDAIVFDPNNAATLDHTACQVPSQPEEPASRENPARWGDLAAMFGLRDAELVGRLEKVPAESPIAPTERGAARLLEMPKGDRVVFFDDLLTHTKLVGLKQLPEPTSYFPGDGTKLQSSYRAIVESPIEEDPKLPLPGWDTITDDQLIEFPEINRVKLIARLGLETIQGSPRRVFVPASRGKYTHGSLIFANPKRTHVFEPV
jgi:hypothetical protein